jgi:membrane-bound metal-dependent hydrolase YbcI (DUF457 family)
MILWHVGITTAAVRYVFRDPAMDLRWVMVGSLLPDVIDKPIGSVFFHQFFEAHRLFAHALVFPIIMLLGVLVVTRRGTGRKAWMGIVIGTLFHLVLDGAWSQPEAFWWPFFGWGFPIQADSAIGALVTATLTDPWIWAGEALGLAYLGLLWRSRLATPAERQIFLHSGRIGLG